MLKKLNQLSAALYIRATLPMLSWKQEFLALKDDERGLSGVVVSVLLILVAVLAVVFLWGNLSEWLQQLWERIIGTAGGI